MFVLDLVCSPIPTDIIAIQNTALIILVLLMAVIIRTINHDFYNYFLTCLLGHISGAFERILILFSYVRTLSYVKSDRHINSNRVYF